MDLQLVDTHAHLNDPAFAGRLEAVVERARQAGVTACVVPSYDPESFSRTRALAEAFPAVVLPAFGIHPWWAHRFHEAPDLAETLRAVPASVAVGEIGLDFYPDCPPPGAQLACFRRQLAVAAEFGLPALVHCRKAFDALYETLRTLRGTPPVVLHSFGGGPEWMARFLDLGVSIAFSGSVTRATARKYHRCAERVPADRLLLETDAPSIATETTVASDVEPAHTAEVAAAVARLRGVAVEDVARHATTNALRLFPAKNLLV
ncbi:MAG: TatD family hydrolase [Acidobacteria bacterium]|nr:TatD family hydrolase [Acidobacteriota bacterium]